MGSLKVKEEMKKETEEGVKRRRVEKQRTQRHE